MFAGDTRRDLSRLAIRQAQSEFANHLSQTRGCFSLFEPEGIVERMEAVVVALHPIALHPDPPEGRRDPARLAPLTGTPKGGPYRLFVDDLENLSEQLPGGSPSFGDHRLLDRKGIWAIMYFHLELDH